MPFVKKAALIILRVGISIILLLFLFRQIDKKTLFSLIKDTDRLLLLFAFLLFFINYPLCLLRWEMLLKAAQIKLPLKRVMIAFSGGIFFSLFLPSSIGGDLMRSIDLATHTRKTKEVVATVILDRLSGYVGLVILALTSSCLGWQYLKGASVLVSLAIITALLIVILLVLFNNFVYIKINKFLSSSGTGKIRESLKDLHGEIYIFRHHHGLMIKVLAMSLLLQISVPISFYFVALSLGIKINPVYFFIFIPIIGAITLLPISLGGLGLRDASTVFFFTQVGVSKHLAFAMSLLCFSFLVIYGAIGGLIYVLTVRHRRRQPHQT